MPLSQFQKELKNYFNEKCFYKIYSLDQNCSTAQIKKAYKRLSLLYHPDRNEESLKEESKIKFQLVSKIYSVLSDENKRSLYDENGTISDFDVSGGDDFKSWLNYWSLIYPKISINEITSFEAKYKNSDEEKEDLKKLYIKYKGNFDKIMVYLMFAEVCEEDRYRTLINDMIKSKEVPEYAPETQASINKRKRRAAKENKEALETTSFGNLELIIKQSQQSRENQTKSFIYNLEAKYGGQVKSNKKIKK